MPIVCPSCHHALDATVSGAADELACPACGLCFRVTTASTVGHRTDARGASSGVA